MKIMITTIITIGRLEVSQARSKAWEIYSLKVCHPDNPQKPSRPVAEGQSAPSDDNDNDEDQKLCTDGSCQL